MPSHEFCHDPSQSTRVVSEIGARGARSFLKKSQTRFSKVEWLHAQSGIFLRNDRVSQFFFLSFSSSSVPSCASLCPASWSFAALSYWVSRRVRPLKACLLGFKNFVHSSSPSRLLLGLFGAGTQLGWRTYCSLRHLCRCHDLYLHCRPLGRVQHLLSYFSHHVAHWLRYFDGRYRCPDYPQRYPRL